MATGNDLCNGALKRLGVLAVGETASANDLVEVQNHLNQLIDSWATERLTIPAVTRTEWTISANDGEYTVGSGGNINIPRPIYVDRVNFQDTSNTPTLEILLDPLTPDAWSYVRIKDLTSDYPTAYYYQPTYASGLGTLYLWPVPTSSTLQGVIYAATQIAQITSFTATITLPPAYQRMIETNLAVEVGPLFGMNPPPILVKQAQDSMAQVKRANIALTDLWVEPGALPQRRRYGAWSIYSGP